VQVKAVQAQRTTQESEPGGQGFVFHADRSERRWFFVAAKQLMH
jgi:hypothetical protein